MLLAPVVERLALWSCLVGVPLLEATFGGQEILEACISATAAQHVVDLFPSVRKMLIDETTHELMTKVQIVLMRDLDVAVRRFKILRKLFLLESLFF